MNRLSLLLLLLLVSFTSHTLFAQLTPNAENAVLHLKVRNSYRASIKKEPIRITSEKTGQTWDGKTNKNGVLQILLPINDKYFFDIGKRKKYDWVRIPDRGWGMTKHTVVYNGPTKKNPKGLQAGHPLLSDMPSIRDGKANIELTFRGMQKQPLDSEVVTLQGTDTAYTSMTGPNGKVAFSVEPGDDYIVKVKYNEKFDVIKIARHSGSVHIQGSYMYRGSKAIEKQQKERKALALEMAKLEKRDEHGHKTQFRAGRVTVDPNPDNYVEAKDYGFDLKLEERTPITAPAWMNGKLYASGGYSSDEFYCFDPATGKTIWQADVSDIGACAVTCKENTVVVNYESCTLFALDGQTGEMRWSWWLGDPLLSSPAIDNGKAFTAYPDGFQQLTDPNSHNSHAFVAFDLQTGDIVWQQWIDGDIISAPVAIHDEIYFSTYGGSVYRLRQEDGQILARENMWATSAPTLIDGKVYVTQHSPEDNSGTRERIVLLDPQSLKIDQSYTWFPAPWLNPKIQAQTAYHKQSRSWDYGNGWASLEDLTIGGITTPKQLVGVSSVHVLQNFTGSRILFFNQRYYLTKGDRVVCLDPANGKQVWSREVQGDLAKEGGYLATAPINAGGYIIVATLSGKILLLNPENGKVEKSWKTEHEFRAQPIAVDGWIYCASTNGQIAAIDTGDPSISGWTALGANPQHTNVNGSKGD